MTERPILFSAPMVRAIVAGTKTQTRRALRHQPSEHYWQAAPGYELHQSAPPVAIDGCVAVKFWHSIPYNPERDEATPWIRCPYGQPGDRLWVREAWKAHTTFDHLAPRDIPQSHVWYMADAGYKAQSRHRQGMFMPRWASRITLEVTGVRVERLQDISMGDCWAEGISSAPDVDQAHEYRDLWESINGPGSWDANPWVWAVSFKRAA